MIYDVNGIKAWDYFLCQTIHWNSSTQFAKYHKKIGIFFATLHKYFSSINVIYMKFVVINTILEKKKTCYN